MLVVLCLLLTGCSSALLDPKGQIGVEQRSLILTSFGLMLIVVIPVIVMTLLFGWRYRRSNSVAKYLPDWAHSNAIEAAVNSKHNTTSTKVPRLRHPLPTLSVTLA